MVGEHMRYIKYPTLDKKIAAQVDALKKEDVRKGYAFGYSVLRYQVEAVCHAVLMRDALQVKNDKDLAQLVKRYEITLPPPNPERDLVRLPFSSSCPAANSYFITPKTASNALGMNGVYVPPVAMFASSTCPYKLFSGDYFNLLKYFPKRGLEVFPEGMGVMTIFAQPQNDFSLLRDRQLCERALRFSQLLFDAAAIDFAQHQNGIANDGSDKEKRPWWAEPEPEHIKQLGNKLTEYYRSIVYNDR